ncbi:solute carrier family 15 member 1-like [Leptopilina heterotoma]|uniref:solute carrier family 15 member 1-like n=1 Tax=Leptopilina heterotoma TaxID=63436 RepID=UPI001CA829C9|nr:solute carrier family 15 member 1-like [Leptopilina heterotoma]
MEYPRAIFLIICTEFCERFSFCGMRTLLSLYLRNVLLFQENESTVIYHIFIMFCYLIPIIGAILADSYLGRFRGMTFIGLFLIACGTGGIKPCVAAFGGDQFHLPLQEKYLQQFFSIFYFTINFGGLVGMILIPVLRKYINCFNDNSCYALGFGFPAALMIISLFQKHWLDNSQEKFSQKLISDIKIVLAVLYLYIPLPIFWSLFDQQGSRWTFQASRMNGYIWNLQILPDQLQVINPALVLCLIPIFDKGIYPIFNKICRLHSALNRMIIGGIFAGFAFITSGFLELQLEFQKLYTMTPPNEIHILWLFPQYFLISVAEIMFAISGLEFSFTQAPKSMKTITIAAWYLSVAIGNLLVIIIIQSRFFQSQANEFFLFAGLIMLNMLIFALMTRRYKFVLIEADSSNEPLINNKSKKIERDFEPF